MYFSLFFSWSVPVTNYFHAPVSTVHMHPLLCQIASLISKCLGSLLTTICSTCFAYLFLFMADIFSSRCSEVDVEIDHLYEF